MGICITPQGCMIDVLDTFWGGLADAMRKAAGDMVTQVFGWWTETGTTSVDAVFLHTAQRYVTTWSPSWRCCRWSVGECSAAASPGSATPPAA
jgi:hypothetical protein